MKVEIDTLLVTPQLNIAIGRIKNPITRKHIAGVIDYVGKQVKLKQQKDDEVNEILREEKE